MSEIAPVTAPAPEPAPEPISMDVASVTAPDGQVEVCNNSHEALKETSEKKQRPRRAVQAAVEPSPAPVIKEAVKVQGNSKKRQRVDPPKRFSKDDAHGEKLIKRLQEIIEGEPDSCDLTLVAEGDVDIRLHSVIARALAPGLKNTLPSLVGTVKMAGISSNVLQALVQYMYRGEIEITDANASETLAAATALGIKGAQDLCGQFLQADVSPVNALSRYSTAIANGLDSLKDAVMDCVDKNFEDVAASPEWLALDKSAVQEVLSRATLRVASEDLVLEALKAWSSNMETSRREAYVELFCDPVAGIRLPYVGKETLVNLDKEEKALLEAEGGQGQTNLSKLVHEELVRRVMNDPTSVQPRVYVDDAGNVAMQDAEDAKSDPKLKAAKKKYVGKKITKMFNGTAYNGSILSVGREQNTNRLLFSIKYEDGDLEDVYQKEADEMMKPKAPPAKAAKKTPGKKTPAK